VTGFRKVQFVVGALPVDIGIEEDYQMRFNGKWKVSLTKVVSVLVILTMITVLFKLTNEYKADPPGEFDLTIPANINADINWLVETYPSGVLYNSIEDRYEVAENAHLEVLGTLILSDIEIAIQKSIKCNGRIMSQNTIFIPNIDNCWDGIVCSNGKINLYNCKIESADIGIHSISSETYVFGTVFQDCSNGIHLSSSSIAHIESSEFLSSTISVDKHISVINSDLKTFPQEPSIQIMNNTFEDSSYGVYVEDSTINISGNCIQSSEYYGLYLENNH
jgi:parallel beta-helix repeat protein